MKNTKPFSILILSLLSFSLLAAAPDTGDTVNRRGAVSDDYYAAGGTITIDANIKGDVIAAGGTVTVGTQVSDDVAAAGGTITVRGQVRDDVRIAGGTLTIDANVGDDLLAAGGTIEITPGARISGNAFIGGGTVDMSGTIDGDLFIGGGKVEIAGIVHGDVQIEAGEIELMEGARIDGNLTYTSPDEAKISPEAVVRGKISYTESERYQYQRSHKGFRFLSVITLSVAGTVLLLVFPNFTRAASARVATEFWKNLGLGFALLVATPVAAILLMSVLVGLHVGLPLLAIYFVALLIAFLIGAFFVAGYGAQLTGFDNSTRGRQVATLIVAMLALALLRFIPVVGGLIIFLLLVTALGAASLQLYDVYRGGKNVVPARTKKTRTKKKSTRR